MPSIKAQAFQKALEGLVIAELCASLPGRFLTEKGVAVVEKDYVFPDPVLPDGYSGGTVCIGGVRGVLVTKAGVRPKVASLHIHGGGWTDGDPTMRIPMITHLCDGVNVDSYSVAYGLAPWHPYPEGLNDCIAFYKGLLDMGYEQILVGGESAGAHLSLCLTLALMQENIQLPTAVWCSSPPASMWFDEEKCYIQDELSSGGKNMRELYAPNGDRNDPLLNPIMGDFHGFPPLLIQCGGKESLSAGAVALAEKACEAGTEVVLHFAQGMTHCFPDPMAPYPEATDGAAEIVAFYNRILNLTDQ